MLRPLIAIPVIALLTVPTVEVLAVKDTAKSSLQRSFSVNATRSLDSMTRLINGEDNSGDDNLEQSSTNSFEVVVVDHIDEAVDGAVALFTRTFETIEGQVAQNSTSRGQSSEAEFALISDITGDAVQFRLQDGDWIAEVPEGSGIDEDYLPGFVAGLDFSELLPEGEVEEGDEWEVSLDLIQVLTRPGGELGLHPEEQDDFNPNDVLPEPERSGSITATYMGHSADAENLGIIEFSIDVESTSDLTAIMQAQMDGAQVPPGTETPQVQSGRRESTLEGSGKALWDIKSHRLHSLELECDSGEEVIREVTFQGDQGEIEFKSNQISSGTVTIEVSQEAL